MSELAASTRGFRKPRTLIFVLSGAIAAAALCYLALVPGECTYGADGRVVEDAGSAAPDGTIAALADRFEAGTIGPAALLEEIAAAPDTALPGALDCDIGASLVLKNRGTPYRIERSLTVADAAVLIVEAGTEIEIAKDADVTVHGRLYVAGSADAPVRIHGATGRDYGSLRLAGAPNRIAHAGFRDGTILLSVAHDLDGRTVLEDVAFDTWSILALHQVSAGPVRVRRAAFGLETEEDDQYAETLVSAQSAGLTVEDSVFGRRRGYKDVIDINQCATGTWAVIRRNVFLGGNDDAIDLDDCAGFVVGNHLENFNPGDPPVDPNANGGCITGSGEASRPVVLNNVLTSCFHAIGFKDGAQALIANNTIVGNTIGITLYKSADDRPEPGATVINNILWDNDSDLVTSGRWWPAYSQAEGPQAKVIAGSNIAGSEGLPVGRDGTLAADPMLATVDGVPIPRAGSVAIDSGVAVQGAEDIPPDLLAAFLSEDFCGNARDDAIDRGAVEASVLGGPCAGAGLRAEGTR